MQNLSEQLLKEQLWTPASRRRCCSAFCVNSVLQISNLKVFLIWVLFSFNTNLSSIRQYPYATRNAENIPFSKQNLTFFKNYVFPSALIEWNNLDHNIRSVGSFSAFKINILKFIRPTPYNVFNCENHRGIKFITRLRVYLSYLREQKFKHSFQDTLNPICSYGFHV